MLFIFLLLFFRVIQQPHHDAFEVPGMVATYNVTIASSEVRFSQLGFSLSINKLCKQSYFENLGKN